MEVCELLTKYPQGGERQLIYAVTGREINSKMLPADAGCIVDNVETMIAIKHAVKDGVPVMKRIATITGDAITTPSNFLYSMGTPYEQLVEAAGQEVEILVGAGVSAANIPALAAQTGARAFHLSGKQVLDSRMTFRREGVPMGLPGFSEFEIWQTSEANIRAARTVLDAL